MLAYPAEEADGSAVIQSRNENRQQIVEQQRLIVQIKLQGFIIQLHIHHLHETNKHKINIHPHICSDIKVCMLQTQSFLIRGSELLHNHFRALDSLLEKHLRQSGCWKETRETWSVSCDLADELFEGSVSPGVGGVCYHRQDGVVILFIFIIQEHKLRPQMSLFCRP